MDTFLKIKEKKKNHFLLEKVISTYLPLDAPLVSFNLGFHQQVLSHVITPESSMSDLPTGLFCFCHSPFFQGLVEDYTLGLTQEFPYYYCLEILAHVCLVYF